jgi:hypothetical protein
MVFVCGMLRSGATLVEQILSSHSQVTAGSEPDLLPTLIRQHLPGLGSGAPIDMVTIARMRERYLATVRGLHPNATVLIDKRPDNFLHIGLIKAMFPQARIIHTRRHPIDNCLAIYFLHLSHTVPYALDLTDVAHWYGQYHRLMLHWKALYGSDILDISYDALVTEPEPLLRDLFGNLGLAWEPACLDFHLNDPAIKTATVWQARQPLSPRSPGRWRNYARHLDPLVAELRRQLGRDLI